MKENIINHVIFGKGIEIAKDDKYIRIKFENEEIGEKTFMYPGAFSKYIAYEDENLQNKIIEILRILQEKADEEKIKAEAIEREKLKAALLAKKKKKASSSTKGKATKTIKSEEHSGETTDSTTTEE